ncbi:phosphoribosylglycinamide formyltransferase [Chryseomicrobium sp. FSL W7-1435]|uniref:phosphoribosylglycinamide formyltransferase n=1 Tax=Chryseomicrobium sp. FSL W7-1435 TaxID=2921704 RepID=UPI003159CBC4
MTIRFAIFASGSGSNAEALYQATVEGQLRGEIVGVFSDKEDAYVLERAKKWGVPAAQLSPKAYASKADYEQAVLDQLRIWQVDFLVLAGYMRLIGPILLSAFPNKIVNIHPSLLPAFPGKDAIGQALAYGVQITGVTVHLVDAGMDTGPILAQRAVEVQGTREQTETFIHAAEHELYKEALDQLWNEERIK